MGLYVLKDKVAPVHSYASRHKDIWAREGVTPRIHSFGTR